MEWYEELDYEENPFKDNEDTELIGYEEAIDEVLYRLESGNLVCVEGKSGAGKTAILKAAINKFKGTGRLVYFNGQDFDNGLNIEKTFKKKVGLMKRLFNKKPKNMIVLFDEVQNISKRNCERLKYYYDNNFIKSAVFTSSDFNKAHFTSSLKERISSTIKLREMTEDEAVDVVQSRLGNDEIIPEEVIKEVFNKSNRNMKLFLKNCESLCQFALENNGRKVEPEHVKELFKESEEIVEKPEEINKEITNKIKKTKKQTSKKTKSKNKKSKEPKQEKKAESEDPMLAVEEPVTVSVSDDFKPQKKEGKMKAEFEDEEIDIDSELKKLGKANKVEDDDLEVEDYEENYEDFKDDDEEEDEDLKKLVDEDEEDIAEKYY